MAATKLTVLHHFNRNGQSNGVVKLQSIAAELRLIDRDVEYVSGKALELR